MASKQEIPIGVLYNKVMIMKITTNHCVACGACVSICPKNCIELKTDSLGFYMPVVAQDVCIQCGRCHQVCPANHRPEGKPWEAGTYYAMWAQDPAMRNSGSSGGIFGMLAEQVLAEGGVVFGATYAPDFKSIHQTSTDHEPLDALKKSKYAESYTGSVFRDVKNALKNGRKVLYCGTSCQIDGLKSYLNGDHPNLLTCDFLCHGVTAAGVFRKFAEDLEAKFGPITHLDFRSKSYGWKAYCTKVQFRSGKTYLRNRFRDPYLRIFFENRALRTGCYSCTRLQNSCADLTLGDFWHVSEVPDIPDTNEGISLVGVHTEAGKLALSRITENNSCYHHQLEQSQYRYAYTRSCRLPEDRQIALQKILNTGNLLDTPIPPAIKLKGLIYQIRAVLQTPKKPRK